MISPILTTLKKHHLPKINTLFMVQPVPTNYFSKIKLINLDGINYPDIEQTLSSPKDKNSTYGTAYPYTN